MIRPNRLFQSLSLVALLAIAGMSAPALAQTQSSVPAKPKPGTATNATAASKTTKTTASKTTASKTTTSKTTPSKAPASKTADSKTSAKPDPKKKPGDAEADKPLLVATYGDWGAYAAKAGSGKTCYALAQPKDREPSNLKRDPAYIFIADRPAENVHNEISIIMGFGVKDSGDVRPVAANAAAAEPTATIGPTKFTLVAKGVNLWLKNAAEEGPMITAMRKNAKLTVQAASLKGNVTTDEYSLSGLAQALDRVQKECR